LTAELGERAVTRVVPEELYRKERGDRPCHEHPDEEERGDPVAEGAQKPA
jgi:hypothetical protein